MSLPRHRRKEYFRKSKNILYHTDFHNSRKSRNSESDLDLSPPRKSRKEFRTSRRNKSSSSDLSPPRKSYEELKKSSRVRKESDSDLRSPRKCKINLKYSQNTHRNSELPERSRSKSIEYRKSKWTRDTRLLQTSENDSQLKKTLDGKTAGLQNAQALREETFLHKKREVELLRQMNDETRGIDQLAVLRDRKTGRRRDLEAEAVAREEKDIRQKEIDAKYSRWGKGLKQVNDQQEKLIDDLYEMSKPLARYADDEDLDAKLRAVEREGDPMLGYIRNRQIKEGKRKLDKPSYKGSYLLNRFGVKPGPRWDGVDRSNGYERKWFEAQNAKTAMREEAYKWSTADM